MLVILSSSEVDMDALYCFYFRHQSLLLLPEMLWAMECKIIQILQCTLYNTMI
jgi:hypothetical protein